MKTFVIILLSAVLIDNYVLSKSLGICPFLGVSKKLDQSWGMGVAVTVVMMLATAVTWPIQTFILKPNGLDYMQTIVFILVIASLVQMVELLLKRFIPALHKGLGVYLPLITTNCAVLDVALANVQGEKFVNSFPNAMVNALGAGLGFLLAMVLFSGVRSRIDETNIPKPFRGLPVTLIAAAFLSLAFLGFAGIVEKMFA